MRAPRWLSRALPLGVAGAACLAAGRRAVEGEELPPAQRLRRAMYIWGNGHYQAQPGGSSAFDNFSPKRISLAYTRAQGEQGVSEAVPLLSTAVFNATHGFGLTEQGGLVAFDNPPLPNTLGDDDAHFVRWRGQRVPRHSVLCNVVDLAPPQPARKIVLTAQHLWALTAKGELYQLPTGALRAETFSRREWRRAAQPGRLRDVAAGARHLLMLGEGGEVWALGEDTFGQCGAGERGRKRGGPFAHALEERPRRVEGLGRADAVWAAGNHSFARTADGELFGFGANTQLQLAHEPEYSAATDPLLALFAPRSFAQYLEEADCALQSLALGDDFSLFVCANRRSGSAEVWGCGNALRGQIPLGFARHLTNFIKVENLSELTARGPGGAEADLGYRLLSCGKAHCLALLGNGMLLVWGDNEFGQIGNKRRSFANAPLLVTPFKHANVLAARASHHSSFALVEEPAAAAPA